MSSNSKIEWTRAVYEIEASDIGTSLKMATAKPLKALARWAATASGAGPGDRDESASPATHGAADDTAAA